MTNEQLRMQFIGGVITESEYKAKIEENKSPKSKKSLNENIVSIGAINNPFPERVKSDYELAFEHFTNDGLNEENLEFDQFEEDESNEPLEDEGEEILFRDFTRGDEKFVNDQEKELSTGEMTYLFYHTYPSMEEAKSDGKEGYVYLERNGKIFSFFPESK